MFRYKSTRDQLIEERRKTSMLQLALDKASADIEYIAMMTDVELDEGDAEVEEDGDQ